jgi:hypothetical protein
VCRVKKHRRGNGHAVRQPRRPPDGTESGWLRGGLTGRMVRDGKQYDATHRLTGSAAEVRRRYRVRAQSEAVIRVGKAQRALTGCQARSARAPLHHRACCLSAFGVLERQRCDQQRRLYTLRRQLSGQGQSCVPPALERLTRAA